MKVYKSKYGKLPGTSYADKMAAARREYHIAQKRTPRRQPYVRSSYFKNDKVFINPFWDHLKPKRAGDQQRRLVLFACALDLIRHTSYAPKSIYGFGNPNIAVHRFEGISKEGIRFTVQIKENKRTNRKDFMSVFPTNKLAK